MVLTSVFTLNSTPTECELFFLPSLRKKQKLLMIGWVNVWLTALSIRLLSEHKCKSSASHFSPMHTNVMAVSSRYTLSLYLVCFSMPSPSDSPAKSHFSISYTVSIKGTIVNSMLFDLLTGITEKRNLVICQREWVSCSCSRWHLYKPEKKNIIT